MPIPYDSVKVVSANFTRPADTTNYVAGDMLSGATSSGTAMTFTNCSRDNGGGGYITDVIIVDSAYSATAVIYKLWLLDTNPTTAVNDNVGFNLSDTEMESVQAVVEISNAHAGSAQWSSAGSAPSRRDARGATRGVQPSDRQPAG
ncbi:MAG: hypothetical protein AAB877_00890 [Patescibacteria group bacterium]